METGDYTTRVHTPSRDEVGQLAEAFNTMSAELEGVERLRRDLVANVSHELKTPITAIRAHLENLLDGVEQPDPETLQVMLAQSERLGRLVDQLLDLSRLESGDVPLDRSPVPLGPLVSQVLSEIDVARTDGASAVSSDIPEDLPPAFADRERVHQVLFNLVDNAVRYTPSGGAVTVSAHRHNGSVEIEVRDTGVGIPAEHLPRLFERFYRVDTSALPGRRRRHRDRPGDRPLGRGGAWRPDPRRERTRRGQHVHVRAPGRRGVRRQEERVKSSTTTIEVTAPERYAFLDLTEELQRAIKDAGVTDGAAIAFCAHTTCALLINEWEDGAMADFRRQMTRAGPARGRLLRARRLRHPDAEHARGRARQRPRAREGDAALRDLARDPGRGGGAGLRHAGSA